MGASSCIGWGHSIVFSSYISKTENGKILPRYDTLVRIAAGFVIEVAELLHRSSSKSRAASEPDQTHP